MTSFVAKALLFDLDGTLVNSIASIAGTAATHGVVALPGAHDLLTSLPPDRWAIVTAYDLETAEARLNAAGLPIPKVLVSANDVEHGKPDPQGYLLGASKLGFHPADCMVFEDAPAGIEAAQRGDMRSIAFRTTASSNDLLTNAEVIVDNPAAISVTVMTAGMLVHVAR
jgi:mannitol-1-/sugar-/sorbitol-6-phosphatase